MLCVAPPHHTAHPLTPVAQAKLDVEAVKAGLKRLLDVQPDSAGKLRFRPPQGLVDVRTAHARMARCAGAPLSLALLGRGPATPHPPHLTCVPVEPD